jgi:glucose-1-phosphate adenylyltransferase
MAHPKVLAFILAGGKGERLFPLTSFRSKPSVPFGGRHRIVDFVLSNFVNSGIYSIYLLVQYKSQSLIEHVRQHWSFSSIVKDHFVAVVPPQMKMGPEWFQGTADAVFQNINLIKDHKADLVVVFGADHIYRMDIRQMIDSHLKNGAAVTVAARPVPLAQASAFGVIATDEQRRIVAFQEKPKAPAPMPGDPSRAYVSMGNYVFNTDVLIESLVKAQKKKEHDFGAHVIPSLVDSGKVFAYDFAGNVVPGTKAYEEQGYWRDVGTIQAYFDAHADLLGEKPAFDMHNSQWPIHPQVYVGPSTRILGGRIKNSMIAEGSIIKKAVISNSIIHSGVVIENDVTIEDCIIMDSVTINKGCRLRRVIVDKNNSLSEGEQIGLDPDKDRFRCHVDQSSGIAIIPRGGKVRQVRK